MDEEEFDNEDPLDFKSCADSFTLHDPDKEKESFCRICSQMILGRAYSSYHESYDEKLWMHESCTKFPQKITHHLHSEHSLTLFLDYTAFICCICRHLSSWGGWGCLRYNCNRCHFTIDAKCFLLMNVHFSKYEPHSHRHRNLHIDLFIHPHILQQCNIRMPYQVWCHYCEQKIDGSAYCCLDCDFFIHESCKGLIWQEVENPYRPQHFLSAQAIDKEGYKPTCSACRKEIISISLTDGRCDFHYTCVKTEVKRPLKHEGHKHNLYYFMGDDSNDSITTFFCKMCSDYIPTNKNYCRCVKCDVIFHLKCIVRPIVEVKCHDHHLILLDSVKEDYFKEEYYCDICEEKGNPNHHLYYCKKCIFIAHTDCGMTEDLNSADSLRSHIIQLAAKEEQGESFLVHNLQEMDMQDLYEMYKDINYLIEGTIDSYAE